MRGASIFRRLFWLALLAFLVLLGLAYARRHPADMPWTPLDLGVAPGAFTNRKLVGLTDDAPRCEMLLARAGVRFATLPPVSRGACGYADGVRFTTGGSRRISLVPASVGTSCAVAAGLALWEWHVLQPAAQRHFGQSVTRIDHYGSYGCRRIGGGGGADGTGGARGYSEHATADAIDIAGFRLADGRRVTVLDDWAGTAAEAAFLHEVRDGACGLFSTVLGPDYNRAHRDHLHLDQAERGAAGWRACR